MKRKGERINFLASSGDLKRWHAAAVADGRTLSDWIRRQLNLAVGASR